MSKVSTNISLDAETKAKAQVMLADLGMDLSTAVNIFLRQMLYEGGIPFSITREVPNKITLDAMKEAQEMKEAACKEEAEARAFYDSLDVATHKDIYQVRDIWGWSEKQKVAEER